MNHFNIGSFSSILEPYKLNLCNISNIKSIVTNDQPEEFDKEFDRIQETFD